MEKSNFWIYVLGSSITLISTLIGIHLTNRANDRRLREQLKHDRELKIVQLDHDRELKNREREMMLRKDIYFAATEAIHACMTLISRLPQLEISNDKKITWLNLPRWQRFTLWRKKGQ